MPNPYAPEGNSDDMYVPELIIIEELILPIVTVTAVIAIIVLLYCLIPHVDFWIYTISLIWCGGWWSVGAQLAKY